MNEIEVKAKLRDKAAVLKKLNQAGLKISGQKHQKDVIFFPNNLGGTITEHHLGSNFLRIREQTKDGVKKNFFTLKQPRSNQTDCIEHEIEVRDEDLATLAELIKTLGYYEFITVKKERQTGKLGNVEICLDEVQDLGSYIELEKFGEEKDAPKIQEELYELLKSWGVVSEDFAYDGYDILVHKKKNNL